eukprot:15357537-Ditylum_brightwellii.AAC.1
MAAFPVMSQFMVGSINNKDGLECENDATNSQITPSSKSVIKTDDTVSNSHLSASASLDIMLDFDANYDANNDDALIDNDLLGFYMIPSNDGLGKKANSTISPTATNNSN